MRIIVLFFGLIFLIQNGRAQKRDSVGSRQMWQAQTTFAFLLGGHSIGIGGSSFGDQPIGKEGAVEQISISCRAPSDVLVQDVTLLIFKADDTSFYRLDFKERAPAPDGTKTFVVSQLVNIRVRFGYGGLGIGLDVWNGPPNMNIYCSATISGYTVTPKSSR